jgi:hypothetical protein
LYFILYEFHVLFHYENKNVVNMNKYLVIIINTRARAQHTKTVSGEQKWIMSYMINLNFQLLQ